MHGPNWSKLLYKHRQKVAFGVPVLSLAYRQQSNKPGGGLLHLAERSEIGCRTKCHRLNIVFALSIPDLQGATGEGGMNCLFCSRE